MNTKEEIVTKLFEYLDLAIITGFFTKAEVKEIYDLEKEYYIQA